MPASEQRPRGSRLQSRDQFTPWMDVDPVEHVVDEFVVFHETRNTYLRAMPQRGHGGTSRNDESRGLTTSAATARPYHPESRCGSTPHPPPGIDPQLDRRTRRRRRRRWRPAPMSDELDAQLRQGELAARPTHQDLAISDPGQEG